MATMEGCWAWAWKEEGTDRWKFHVSNFEEDMKSGRMLQDFLVSECMGAGEKTAGKFAALGEELWKMAYDRNGAEILRKRMGAAEAAGSPAAVMWGCEPAGQRRMRSSAA